MTPKEQRRSKELAPDRPALCGNVMPVETSGWKRFGCELARSTELPHQLEARRLDTTRRPRVEAIRHASTTSPNKSSKMSAVSRPGPAGARRGSLPCLLYRVCDPYKDTGYVLLSVRKELVARVMSSVWRGVSVSVPSVPGWHAVSESSQSAVASGKSCAAYRPCRFCF